MRLSSASMSAIVPSATPPQFASVGQCVTSTPSALAASRSTSSTPIVYFATILRSAEIERNAWSITPRKVAPRSAAVPLARSASSARAAFGAATTTSQPAAARSACDAPLSSTGR
jgi:hypothetical protein